MNARICLLETLICIALKVCDVFVVFGCTAAASREHRECICQSMVRPFLAVHEVEEDLTCFGSRMVKRSSDRCKCGRRISCIKCIVESGDDNVLRDLVAHSLKLCHER